MRPKMSAALQTDFSGWKLFATAVLVALNGIFVAAEFALVKVRSARIDALANKGKKKAGMVRHILSDLNLYLSACQLGITLASLALGWLAEPAIATLLVSAAESAGINISNGPAVHIARDHTLRLATLYQADREAPVVRADI